MSSVPLQIGIQRGATTPWKRIVDTKETHKSFSFIEKVEAEGTKGAEFESSLSHLVCSL